jgi:hypothetical protein
MKIDLDEIKRMLNVFLDTQDAFITLNELGVKTVSDEDKFIGHLLLLVEGGYISNRNLETGSPKAIGLHTNMRGWDYAITPIRLTQSGHDFAKILNQKPVLERLKKDAMDAPFSLLQKLGNALAEKYFIEKLGLSE